MAGGTKKEMGAILPCGKQANKPIPQKGVQQPAPPEKQQKNFKLKVRIHSGAKDILGAKVIVNGVAMDSDKFGFANFGTKPAGEYEIKVTFSATDDYVDLKSPVKFNLSADTIKSVEVEAKNIITAIIETEYKVVVLDRKLTQYQATDESKVLTNNVSYIQISFDQTNKAFEYKKDAKLTCSGSGSVDVFSDPECKHLFDGSIKSSVINSGRPIKYYLKSKTAGKFTIAIDLPDPSDPKIKIKKAKVEEEMSVCEISLKLFWHDQEAIKNKKITQDLHPISKYHDALKGYQIPAQKEMSDEEKVKKGRLLHVQNSGSHGRAKIIVKINTGQWPDESNDNELIIVPTQKSGSVKIFDAEWEGNEVKQKDGIKISDLKKSNGVKELWVEGSSACSKLRDLSLGISLDRPDKGLSHEPKLNADWARFTVVKIEKVEIKYKAPASEPSAWDESEGKFYINFKTDPDGRKIKIGATLSQKLKGVTIHFMLAGDKDNMKQANWGIDMPGTWKWSDIKPEIKQKDRDNRDDLMHLKKETDDNGHAEIELQLSRFGGDKFIPACYISEDPQLAKYIHGHTDLEKKKPVFCSKTIKVWRKFWYRRVVVEGVTIQDMALSEQKYKNVKVTMEQFLPDLKITRAQVNAMVPKAIYPNYMIKVNGGNDDALLISDKNKGQFYTIIDAEVQPALNKLNNKPYYFKLVIPIILCNAQWDWNNGTELSSSQSSPRLTSAQFPYKMRMDKLAISPNLNGGKLKAAGTWKSAEYDNVANAWVNVQTGSLADDEVYIDPNRAYQKDIAIKLPAGITVLPNTYIWIKDVQINGAAGIYLGESAKRKILAVCGHPEVFNHVVGHEIGHAFNQTPVKGTMVPATGIPEHPKQYVRLGSHCEYDNQACMMHGLVDGDTTNAHYLRTYCPECHPYLIVENFEKYK